MFGRRWDSRRASAPQVLLDARVVSRHGEWKRSTSTVGHVPDAKSARNAACFGLQWWCPRLCTLAAGGMLDASPGK